MIVYWRCEVSACAASNAEHFAALSTGTLSSLMCFSGGLCARTDTGNSKGLADLMGCETKTDTHMANLIPGINGQSCTPHKGPRGGHVPPPLTAGQIIQLHGKAVRDDEIYFRNLRRLPAPYVWRRETTTWMNTVTHTQTGEKPPHE